MHLRRNERRSGPGVPLATSRKKKTEWLGLIVDYELRQTTIRWAGFCSRESREGPALRARGGTENRNCG